jgi:hypothetical protein
MTTDVKAVLSGEETQDAIDYVETALAEGIGEIEDMLRRRASRYTLKSEEALKIRKALDLLNSVKVGI